MAHRPPGGPRAPEPVYNHAGAAADPRNPFAQPGVPVGAPGAPYQAGFDSSSDVGDYTSRRNTYASEPDASNPALADGQYYDHNGYDYRECLLLFWSVLPLCWISWLSRATKK